MLRTGAATSQLTAASAAVARIAHCHGEGPPETRTSRAQVDAFHAAAIEAGGTDNGAPGVRTIYHPDYYGGYVLDPDGNHIEAVCHRPG